MKMSCMTLASLHILPLINPVKQFDKLLADQFQAELHSKANGQAQMPDILRITLLA
jgi:hypothetical protein